MRKIKAYTLRPWCGMPLGRKRCKECEKMSRTTKACLACDEEFTPSCNATRVCRSCKEYNRSHDDTAAFPILVGKAQAQGFYG